MGFDAAPVLEASVNTYRKRNPGRPVEIFYLPAIVRLMMRGIQENGVLNGAMDQAEADRIVSLIPGAAYMRIDALHVIHLAKLYIHLVIVFLIKTGSTALLDGGASHMNTIFYRILRERDL